MPEGGAGQEAQWGARRGVHRGRTHGRTHGWDASRLSSASAARSRLGAPVARSAQVFRAALSPPAPRTSARTPAARVTRASHDRAEAITQRPSPSSELRSARAPLRRAARDSQPPTTGRALRWQLSHPRPEPVCAWAGQRALPSRASLHPLGPSVSQSYPPPHPALLAQRARALSRRQIAAPRRAAGHTRGPPRDSVERMGAGARRAASARQLSRARRLPVRPRAQLCVA
ncbi:hypothetical protein CERSUDRAFT_96108 [Gelatoporia subvermispora B]|uniref:Uncharacterized protein n=1 Tax=Ceriporiopsis subvermispora (strain B) TaxID=914234 RepID=M2RAS6_CERS8|nr:hypothetical protein CERSUDRAFT_96108 [Gelatoporia subvermispora B]